MGLSVERRSGSATVVSDGSAPTEGCTCMTPAQPTSETHACLSATVLTGAYDVLARVTRVLWHRRSLADQEQLESYSGRRWETATQTAGRR